MMRAREFTLADAAVQQFTFLSNAYHEFKIRAYDLIRSREGISVSIAVAPKFDLKTCMGKTIHAPKPWAGIYVLDVKNEVRLRSSILRRERDFLPSGNYYRIEISDISFDEKLYSHEKEWGFSIIYLDLILQRIDGGQYIHVSDLKKGLGLSLSIEELLQQ